MDGIPARIAVLGASCLLVLAGCAGSPRPPAAAPATTATQPPSAPPAAPAAPSATPDTAVSAEAEDLPRVAAAEATGRTLLRIPGIGLDRLRVVAYRGTADDQPGTVIQDRGRLATPRGPRGGVAPGVVGNMIVTGHRTSAGAPFGALPALGKGEQILVDQGDWTFVYRVTRTMTISFRSGDGRAAQSAPVPGRPGVPATRPMITLSTCATPEDHAAHWPPSHNGPPTRTERHENAARPTALGTNRTVVGTMDLAVAARRQLATPTRRELPKCVR